MCRLRTWTPTPGVGIILQLHNVKQTHAWTCRARTCTMTSSEKSESSDMNVTGWWDTESKLKEKSERLTLPVSASRNRSLKESCDWLSSGWIWWLPLYATPGQRNKSIRNDLSLTENNSELKSVNYSRSWLCVCLSVCIIMTFIHQQFVESWWSESWRYRPHGRQHICCINLVQTHSKYTVFAVG